jgi:hypothetical protein
MKTDDVVLLESILQEIIVGAGERIPRFRR